MFGLGATVCVVCCEITSGELRQAGGTGGFYYHEDCVDNREGFMDED